MVKYIFVTGGVLSSVGKGILTSSIGKMLQARSLKPTVIKIDPYVNIDAGTMNPYMHGEVFVTDDGGEADLDLGWYERFLDLSLKQDNNLTTGTIYRSVIEKERHGDFLGRCVQIVPHVTNEIKNRIKNAGRSVNADIVLVEVGGTVGDIEGLPFLEAIRQMRVEEGYENTLYVHVALVPILDVTSEMKTKPLQHSVNELRRIGIQPDVIVARSPMMIDAETLRKIALFGTIPESSVFCSCNAETVYQVPLILDKQGMGDFICQRLGFKCDTKDFGTWQTFVDAMVHPEHEVRVALVGKYAGLTDSYVSMTEALRHGGAACKTKVNISYLEAEKFEREPECINELQNFDGVFVPYGFGPRGTEGKIAAAKYTRENNLPFLGICYGFQLAVIEFARNVAGLTDANSSEINPDTPYPVIDLMPEQRGIEIKGATMRLGTHKIILEKNSLAYHLFGQQEIHERHRHRFEVNLDYIDVLKQHGLRFTGKSSDGRRMETLELPDKYFYFASQFHGEFKSRPGRPSPEYYGFISACINKKLGKPTPFSSQ
ncbi:MAG: CTP synthase [Nitrososphaerota archaeon]|jgi:CTP synthase|uniref:CTP synthase n=1 Tax=Candidatus Bathycorpusculum sp. TaxID=2994959 RepID=UPI0028217654|nr:CTP synthase [Candidatus Termitimicrobium sp.]MCL2432377.1 CTP synthase [Candidatus Termitimicrobium sp.]MDR0493169.1 CTP synthase [Nitrososphaerota archaeon]